MSRKMYNIQHSVTTAINCVIFFKRTLVNKMQTRVVEAINLENFAAHITHAIIFVNLLETGQS